MPVEGFKQRMIRGEEGGRGGYLVNNDFLCDLTGFPQMAKEVT